MDRDIQVFIADSRDMAGSIPGKSSNWQLTFSAPRSGNDTYKRNDRPYQ